MKLIYIVHIILLISGCVVKTDPRSDSVKFSTSEDKGGIVPLTETLSLSDLKLDKVDTRKTESTDSIPNGSVYEPILDNMELLYVSSTEGSQYFGSSTDSNANDIKTPFGTIEYHYYEDSTLQDNLRTACRVYSEDNIMKHRFYEQEQLVGRKEFIEKLQLLVGKFPKLKNYKIGRDSQILARSGDYFGNGNNDIVLYLTNSNGHTSFAFIDYSSNTNVHLIDEEENLLFELDYIELTAQLEAGDTIKLSNNYKNEELNSLIMGDSLLILPNDALLMMQKEACGGTTIFWANNKFYSVKV